MLDADVVLGERPRRRGRGAEVAELGLLEPQGELVGVRRAVEKHVTSIFSKLDLTPTVEDHRRVLAVLAYLRSS